jgi:hypothetical protein
VARWLTALATLLCAAPLASCDVITGGCGDELDDQPPVTSSVGTTDGGIYQSSSWSSVDWVDFPPGISVRFEHNLGETPRLWHAYVATQREGDGSNLVLASGSEAELIDIDDEAVTIKNATCVDFFVVLVAMTSVEDERSTPP